MYVYKNAQTHSNPERLLALLRSNTYMKKIITLVVVWLTTHTAHAQGLPYTLLVPFPGQSDEVSGPAQYIKQAYSYGLGLGALLAMAMIVIGAVQYTLSEAVTSKEDAKDRITKAVWGLVLLIAATLILNTLNPDFNILNDPNLN